jgi:queuine tRNA-ribosyltransferase
MTLDTPHGALRLPSFLPDATRGVVRAADPADLRACGIQGLMVNALHLGERPGASVVKSAGGIHAFTGFPGPVFSDSGGYQVFSLIRQSKSNGTVTEQGFIYRANGKRHELTPRKAMRRQWDLGADVLFCLDHCTHPADPPETQRESVATTVRWARECSREHRELIDGAEGSRPSPLLYAVVQGGADLVLRRQCIEELATIGFDGYGFGGWPVGEGGALEESVAFVAEALPGRRLHALGIGSPANVLAAAAAGYSTFDCVIPTRDARHGRLYLRRAGGEGFTSISARDERWIRDFGPVDPSCDCPCCRQVSRAYLFHLFALEDHSAYRLATLHNLRFYASLMEGLRARDGDSGAGA